MSIAAITSEFFYSCIGAIFILVGMKALRDTQMEKRITTALFWFLLAFAFIIGPHMPSWVTGICVIAIAVLTGLKRVIPSKSDVPDAASTRQKADIFGYKVFIPALCLAVVAMLSAALLPVFGANNAIGISSLVALVVLFALTRAPAGLIVTDAGRMMDSVGPAGILPQILAALGSLFTVAGVGDVIAKGVSLLVPDGSRLIACMVYCAGMFAFTLIMGNSFAAFSVITAGIGLPFLILQGANPAVVGALGLTAGYCGTLCTPMAANFNIMPAALLETKDKYVVIKTQLPIAVVMLCVHIVLMYLLAF